MGYSHETSKGVVRIIDRDPWDEILIFTRIALLITGTDC